ncbi:hypothetical protein AAMO2058_001555400 [Amorphochlora amoebiformis]
MRNIDTSTAILTREIVPRIARELDKEGKLRGILFTEPVSGLLHKEGVNMRHLGLLRFHSRNPKVRVTLLVEMVGRTLKHILRAELRRIVRSWTLPSEYRMRQQTVNILNILIGNNAELSPILWNRVLNKILIRFGDISLDPIPPSYVESKGVYVEDGKEEEMYPPLSTPTGEVTDVAAGGLVDGKELFRAARNHMKRILGRLPVKFTAECTRRMEFGPKSIFRFNIVDLLAPGVRVKKMGILDFANAQLLSLIAKRELAKRSLPVAMEMFRLAGQAFQRTLQSHPDDTQADRERKFVMHMGEALRFGPQTLSSSIDWAIYHGKKEILMELSEGGSKDIPDIPMALYWAVDGGHRDIAIHLLRSKAFPETKYPHDNNNTVLHLAVRNGDEKLVDELIYLNADPNAKNDLGQTPLLNSVCNSILFGKLWDFTVKETKFAANRVIIDLTVDNKHNSLLHAAAAKTGPGVLEKLLKQNGLWVVEIADRLENKTIPSPFTHSHDKKGFRSEVIEEEGDENSEMEPKIGLCSPLLLSKNSEGLTPLGVAVLHGRVGAVWTLSGAMGNGDRARKAFVEALALALERAGQEEEGAGDSANALINVCLRTNALQPYGLSNS